MTPEQQTDEQLDELVREIDYCLALGPSTIKSLVAVVAEVRESRKLWDEVEPVLRNVHRRMPDNTLADASNKMELEILLARYFSKEPRND